MLVGYLSKRGIEIYHVRGSNGSQGIGVTKRASGLPQDLRPLGLDRLLGKRLLIVGRDVSLHIKRRYPPATYKDLNKAVGVDIEELFPIKDPSYYIKLSEQTTAYSLVDIWGWSKADTDRVRDIFPFNYIAPEDALFISEGPELSILTERGSTYAVAHSREGFIACSVINDPPGHSIDRLLKGISRQTGGVKRANLYGVSDKALVDALRTLVPETVNKQSKPYPVCIDHAAARDLRDFKTAPAQRDVLKNIYRAMRLFIYLLLASTLSLFITNRDYDLAIGEMKDKISAFSKESVQEKTEDDYADVLEELHKKMEDPVDHLQILDLLAGLLPEKSHVTRLNLNDKNLELALMSTDPLVIVKKLGESDMFGVIRLKGTPMKDARGIYTFTITAELR